MTDGRLTLRHDERGTETVVTHVLAIGITSLLLIGLLLAASTYLNNQRELVAEKELDTIGNRMANELAQLDRLSAGGGRVSVTSNHPAKIAGGPYDVRIARGATCDTSQFTVDTCLVLDSEAVDVTRKVPLQNDTTLAVRSLGNGRFRLISRGNAANAGDESVTGVVELSMRVGVGASVNRQSTGSTFSLGNNPPSAGFQFSPDPPSSDQTIRFDANESRDPDGTIKNYTWRIENVQTGNVDVLNGKIATYSPPRPGEFNVTLEVNDTLGASATAKQVIRVSGLEYQQDMIAQDVDTGCTTNCDPAGVEFSVKNNWSEDVYITDIYVNPPDEVQELENTCSSGCELGSGNEIAITNPLGSDFYIDEERDDIPEDGFIQLVNENAGSGSPSSYDTYELEDGETATFRVYSFDRNVDERPVEFAISYTFNPDDDGAANTTFVRDVPGIDVKRLDLSDGANGVNLTVEVDQRLDSSDTLKLNLTGDADDNAGPTGDPQDLARSDFTEIDNNGTWLYRMRLNTSGTADLTIDPSDDYFRVVIADIVNNTGAPAETPAEVVDAYLWDELSTNEYEWTTAADWDAGTGSRLTHASFGTHYAGDLQLGYGTTDEGGNSLEAYWSLDEQGSPTVTRDWAGNGHEGILENTPSPGFPGIDESDAYSFGSGGSNDWIRVTDRRSLSGGPGTTITASGWFNPDPGVTIRESSIVSKEAGFSAGDWGLTFEDNCPGYATCVGSPPYVGYYGEDGTDYGLFYGPVDKGRWQHAAFTLDYGNVDENPSILLYYDGQLVAREMVAPNGSSVDSSNPVEIGAVTYKNEYFRGDLDEIRLYDRNLSASEVRNLYAAGFNGTMTTDWQSGPAIGPGSLELEYNVTIGSGEEVNVTVVSDAGAGDVSDTITLGPGDTGTGTKSINGLSSAASRYRLEIRLESDDPEDSPVVHGFNVTEGP